MAVAPAPENEVGPLQSDQALFRQLFTALPVLPPQAILATVLVKPIQGGQKVTQKKGRTRNRICPVGSPGMGTAYRTVWRDELKDPDGGAAAMEHVRAISICDFRISAGVARCSTCGLSFQVSHHVLAALGAGGLTPVRSARSPA